MIDLARKEKVHEPEKRQARPRLQSARRRNTAIQAHFAPAGARDSALRQNFKVAHRPRRKGLRCQRGKLKSTPRRYNDAARYVQETSLAGRGTQDRKSVV